MRKSKIPSFVEQHFKVRVPIFDSITVHLVITSDILISCVNFGLVPSAEEGADWASARAHTSILNNTKGCHVYIMCDNKVGLNRRTMVHECKHVGSAIMKTVGISADHDNDEAEAYVIDWVFGWIEGCVSRSKFGWKPYFLL